MVPAAVRGERAAVWRSEGDSGKGAEEPCRGGQVALVCGAVELVALWCRDLKTVTPTSLDVPKVVTLVMPYYENPLFFRAQIARWLGWHASALGLLSVIVVDDGSQVYPAVDVVRSSVWPSWLRIFRIDTDVRWNWLAARNIGAHYAERGWLLLTDMDHVVPEETWIAACYGDHDPSVVYAFQRQEHTGQAAAPHSASFLMHRDLFWTIGGYDEALSGYYGTDGVFRRDMAKVAKMALLTDTLIRHEYVGDSSTSTYKRKQPEDARVRELVAARKPGWRPKTLSFPYHEVTA